MDSSEPPRARESLSSTQVPYGIPPPGYRLPAETRVGRVTLEVADLGVSLPFYEQVLGLEPVDRTTAHAALASPGDRPPLVELRERRGARPVPRRGRLGLFHFAILLPERAALGRFLAHLDRLGLSPGVADHSVSEALYLSDPDGLGIEVYADRPRADWRARDRELVMTTDPLDVEDLFAAGGGVPWHGAPAGTTMGHVHLHVGDLERAAEFYHRGLGFDQTVWSYPGALFFGAGGYHHHLGTNVWARGAEPAREGDARLLEWEIEVPAPADATAALGSVAALGAAVEPRDDGGVARDPWGVRVRVTGRAAVPSSPPPLPPPR